MREKYETLQLSVLRDIARHRGLKHISALRKAELIDALVAEDDREAEQQKNEKNTENHGGQNYSEGQSVQPVVSDEQKVQEQPAVSDEQKAQEQPAVSGEQTQSAGPVPEEDHGIDADQRPKVTRIFTTEPRQNPDRRNSAEPRQNTDRRYNAEPRQNADRRNTTEPRQSADRRYNVEPRQSTDRRYNVEPRQSTDRRNSAEQRQSTDRRNSAEQRQSTDRRNSAEQRQNTDRRNSAEQRQSTDCRNSAEQRQSTDRRNSAEQRQSTDRRYNVEPRQNTDRRNSMERRQNTDRRNRSATAAVAENESRSGFANTPENLNRSALAAVAENESRSGFANTPENLNRSASAAVAENESRSGFANTPENLNRSASAAVAENESRSGSANTPENLNRSASEAVAENESRSGFANTPENLNRSASAAVAENESRFVSATVAENENRSASVPASENQNRESQNRADTSNSDVGRNTQMSSPERVSTDLSSLDSGNEASGILEVLQEGYGFIRSSNYLSGDNDVYVAPSQIRRFGLRTGDVISGNTRVKAQQEKFSALLFIKSINGLAPTEAVKRYNFENMTPIFPNQRLRMERGSGETAMRIVDLFSPIGRGQRGMIVSPPKAGKTTLLKDIARSILANEPDMHIIILLIDERPEEVTDIREAIVGKNVEVIYSTFDELPEHHKRVSEMGIERAKRLVEHRQHVTILLDSITRLARAYNLTVPPSGRTLSGGLDPAALHMPKRFFGAARNMREGGSLTILATALVDTGSKMDDVVYEEFKGTGNMELVLDRKLSERRVFPAIDIQKSGTRREDLLLTPEEQEACYIMRKALNSMKGEEAVENILNMVVHTRDNAELVARVRRQRFI